MMFSIQTFIHEPFYFEKVITVKIIGRTLTFNTTVSIFEGLNFTNNSLSVSFLDTSYFLFDIKR